MAPSLGADLISGDLGGATEIDRAIAAFAHSSGSGSTSGLIVTTSAIATVHRKLIIALAARHKLPAVYSRKLFVTNGGLISYGTDPIDQYRRAAGYVDRILRGEKPGDLPVQAPTKFELVVNLNTAKALGLEDTGCGAGPRRWGDRVIRGGKSYPNDKPQRSRHELGHHFLCQPAGEQPLRGLTTAPAALEAADRRTDMISGCGAPVSWQPPR